MSSDHLNEEGVAELKGMEIPFSIILLFSILLMYHTGYILMDIFTFLDS